MRENTDQNNFEYGHFLYSGYCKAALKVIQKLQGKYVWLGLFLVQFGAESEEEQVLSMELCYSFQSNYFQKNRRSQTLQ